jgi:hypothetical protein
MRDAISCPTQNFNYTPEDTHTLTQDTLTMFRATRLVLRSSLGPQVYSAFVRRAGSFRAARPVSREAVALAAMAALGATGALTLVSYVEAAGSVNYAAVRQVEVQRTGHGMRLRTRAGHCGSYRGRRRETRRRHVHRTYARALGMACVWDVQQG